MILKVKVTRPLEGVFAEYQPEVGKVYEASYSPPKVRKDIGHHYAAVCVINVNGKKICLRQNEYEMCDGEDCIDVTTLTHKKFKTYAAYKKFILRSREKKEKRYTQ